MTDKPNQKPWGWGSAVWIVLSLLTLYVLSMGPVWWAVNHFHLWRDYPIAGSPEFTFYAPVFWACEACHPFGDALIWYVRLWADIAG
jgi:hypothetical protein